MVLPLMNLEKRLGSMKSEMTDVASSWD